MPTLFDKIYGIEAATTIANSMGDVMEGMTWDQIEETYGLVTELLPQLNKWGTELGDVAKVKQANAWGYPFVFHVHDRPPGTGEDGHERYRLAVTAIIEKGGRISVEDLARIWIRDIKPENFGYLLGPQDQVIYYGLKAGVFPWETGRYATFPGMIGTSKMMHAIGVINACDPDQAAKEAFDVGRIKDIRGPRDNYALEVAAGTAEGLKPWPIPAIWDPRRSPRADPRRALGDREGSPCEGLRQGTRGVDCTPADGRGTPDPAAAQQHIQGAGGVTGSAPCRSEGRR